MQTQRLSRYAAALGVATAMVTGCGGSHPPIGAPGAMLQASITAQPALGGKSWMMPEAKGNDLIYALTARSIAILTYPAGKLVAKITENLGENLCSNPNNGDVFVTSSTRIYKFAHGGTQPIATLQAPSSSYRFFGCSVNGTTGDLAVASVDNKVVVYPRGSGTPTVYTDPDVNYFSYCGYDSSGNLFVDGVATDNAFLFAELPSGRDSLINMTLNEQLSNWVGPVQWDGTYITVERRRRPTIHRISVSGSSGTIVGTTTIRNQTKTKNEPEALTWIQGAKVIAAEGAKNKRLAYWNYPAGGKPTKVLNDLLKSKKDGFGGLTVSVAPSR